MEEGRNGGMEEWSGGVVEWWSGGVVERWSEGVMESWSEGIKAEKCAVSRLRQAGAVKAIGVCAALRVREIESSREDVGPDRQPVHQIRRSFNHDRVSRGPRENEAEPP